MPMQVRDDGPLNAKLVLVGEAPGAVEMERGIPFVGKSGGLLAVWWRQFGLARSDFYITNVVPYQPKNINQVPIDEMQEHIANLHTRLAKLENPAVIVPVGNYALYALTGKGKVSWHKKDGKVKRPGILDWRGSLLTYKLGDRLVKVIPTLHPAFVLRNIEMERRSLHDWHRIAEEVASPSIELPSSTHEVYPDILDVERGVLGMLHDGLPISLDIETPKGKVTMFQMLDGTWKSGVKKSEESQVAKYRSGKKKGQPKTKRVDGGRFLDCIGLANDVDRSLVVPLTIEYWRSAERLNRARDAIQRLLSSSVPLVVQNGVSFDIPWLLHEGFEVNLSRDIWDTMAMHHCLDPRDDHDLGYLASIYTRYPFWKHEAHRDLRVYCGKDVIGTLQIYRELQKKLAQEGLLEFYREHYIEIAPALIDMTMHGIQVDEECRTTELAKLKAIVHGLMSSITEAAGLPLIAKKGLSNDRLKFLFYGKRGFEGARAEASYAKLQAAYPEVQPYNLPPLRTKNTKGERSITVNEVAIRKLMMKAPKIVGELGVMLLRYRECMKQIEFIDGRALDDDSRMRCSYGFDTEAGRLKSAENPWGKGRNLQNIDRTLRFVFIPDQEV